MLTNGETVMYTPSVEGIIEAAVKKRSDERKSATLHGCCLNGRCICRSGHYPYFQHRSLLLAAQSPLQTMLMGMSFGLALTLVIFAGSELFTGNNMFYDEYTRRTNYSQ